MIDIVNIWAAVMRSFAFILIFMIACLPINQSLSQTNVEPNAKVVLTPEEQIWISEHPTIRVTNEMDWMPIDFVRAGEPAGFSIDYMNLIARKVGLNIEYINGYNWDELLTMLKNGEIDATHSVAMTPARLEFLNFSAPYIDIPNVYYGKVNSERIETLEDLSNKRIGVTKGSGVAEMYLETYPHFQLINYDSTKSGLLALSFGDVDVFIGSLQVTNNFIANNFITDVEIIGSKFFPEDGVDTFLRIASRKDMPTLSSILTKGMAAVTDEEFMIISRSWLTHTSNENDLNLTPEELRWLSNHKVIKVAVDPFVPPIEFIEENGEINGIAREYLDIISEKLNVEFVWAGNNNWSEALEMIKSGEADIISAIKPIAARRSFVDFTDSYITVSSVIFARENGGVFRNMDSLAGYKVAQVKNDATTELIKSEYPNIVIVEVNDFPEALRMLSTGSVDAYVSDILTSMYIISKEGLTNIRVVGEAPYAGGNAMGIRNKLPLLSSSMKKAMSSISEVEKAKISRKWQSLKIESEIDYSFMIQVFAVAAVIIIIILFWVVKLRNEVDRRVRVEKALVVAKIEAENSNNAKSAFLANMSHEIRTPLNAIIGFSDLIILGILGKPIDSKYQEYAKDIKVSGEHLSNVISNILDLSKIEAGKWRLDECNINIDHCLDASIKMISKEAKSKNITITKPFKTEGYEFFADEVCIRRILINLLSNAVKFTLDDGEINCNIRITNNNDLLISIEDNGIGIPLDRIDNVLKPFEQSHEDFNLNESGTGLGLSIVSELIELHEGTFQLLSEQNVGTEAIVIFPAYRVSTTQMTNTTAE